MIQAIKSLCICICMLNLLSLHGQKLEGRLIDSQTKEPLEYVSIGIMGTSQGATTDEEGYFSFDTQGQTDSARLRISMIGYEAKIYTLGEMRKIKEDIPLSQTRLELEEVVVRAVRNERKVGATRSNLMAGWSGWGGMFIRKGFEMGTRISLGDQPVKVKTLHVRFHRQAFDTSYFRLHMRAMEDTTLGEELLRENIIFSMDVESGWAEMDLEDYNLWLSGDVALTLEWLKVQGLQKDRAMKINKKETAAYILFKNTKGACGLYRWGTEARWIVNKKLSPSMYLSILE